MVISNSILDTRGVSSCSRERRSGPPLSFGTGIIGGALSLAWRVALGIIVTEHRALAPININPSTNLSK